MGEPSERVALVVGGTKGIGGAVSRRLARQASVVAAYRNDVVSAHGLERWGREEQLPVTTYQVDVSSKKGVDELVDAVIDLHGRLDVIVFSAVDARLRAPLAVTEDDWREVIATNTSPFLWLGQRAAEVASDGGRLIALTSPFSRRYVEGYGAIGPSKAALESLVVYLAVALAPKGVTVNAVSGGLIDTELLRAQVDEPAITAVARRTPVGRIGHPEDIAALVEFLVAETSTWMTGQVVTMDGGYFLR
jgi:NAD(P)-dependent dehydrogenase (short-subunit alcohol dehydrogenase family)